MKLPRIKVEYIRSASLFPLFTRLEFTDRLTVYWIGKVRIDVRR